MAQSSLLGGDQAPPEPSGKDIDALGPSDSSDSGSDVQADRGRSALPDPSAEGALSIAHGSDTYAAGTGERAAADPGAVRENADILRHRGAESAADLAVSEDELSTDEDDAE